MLGGTGAGLLVACVIATPAPRSAILASLVLAAAGLGVVWRFKFVLVTRAAFNQGFALPHLPVRGAR